MAERPKHTCIEDMPSSVVERYKWAIREIRKAYPRKKTITVLDIAAGSGSCSLLMAKQGFHVHAVDNSIKAKQLFDNYYKHPLVRFELADVMDFEPVIRGYDVMVSLESIEHLEDDYAFIQKIKDCAPLWIISVPNETKIPFKSKSTKYHKRHYTKDQLSDLLPDGKRTWYTQLNKTRRAEMIPMDEVEGRTLGVVLERGPIFNV